MTEIATLNRRRELVVLAAELQRANIARRLGHIEGNPAHKALGYAARVAKRPVFWKLGSTALGFAVRAYRKRRAAKRRHLVNH